MLGRLAVVGVLLPGAEAGAEAACGDARRRRVERGRDAAGGRPVPGVARGAAALDPHRLDLPGEVAVAVPHHPRRSRPPERAARPLQPRHRSPLLLLLLEEKLGM